MLSDIREKVGRPRRLAFERSVNLAELAEASKAGYSARQLAEYYGVSVSTVRRALEWAHKVAPNPPSAVQ